MRRAVGIVRVSRKGDREGESFRSPSEQRERIRAAAERDGLKLVNVIEEIDVSGGTPLDRRAGLRSAVEAVENGDIDVIVVAYFDRLVRSLAVQAELVERVEKAGGAILTVEVGEISTNTASLWLSSTMLGTFAEYQRRTTAERTEGAKLRAVAEGIPPYPNIPPGYRRRDDRRLEPDDGAATAVADAFRMRADGATIAVVREHLRAHGIERSYHGVQALLSSRVYLGELRFGEIVNESSHPALIDAETWRRVERVKVPRGRRPKSERLLARLGVLRCGTCGARLVVGFRTTRNGKRYDHYRCSPLGDCSQRVTISADVAEGIVVDAVKELLEGIEGTAALDDGLADAEREAERAEAELEATVRAFSVLDDVAAAQERLLALREARDRAREHLDDLRSLVAPVITVTAADWDDLTMDERRDLIRAVVDRAVVMPGKGADRIRVERRL